MRIGECADNVYVRYIFELYIEGTEGTEKRRGRPLLFFPPSQAGGRTGICCSVCRRGVGVCVGVCGCEWRCVAEDGSVWVRVGGGGVGG